MLKKQLKRSARYNEDGSLPELIGKDLQRNLDDVDTKLEKTTLSKEQLALIDTLLAKENISDLKPVVLKAFDTGKLTDVFKMASGIVLRDAENNNIQAPFKDFLLSLKESMNEAEEDTEEDDAELQQAIELYKSKGYLDEKEDADAIAVLKAADYTIKTNSRGIVTVVELERMHEAEDDAEAPAEEETEDDAEDNGENLEDEIPDHLETDLEEPEETFKDINEKVVVYLYRGFAEMGDQVRLFVEDTDNEERDPELVEILENFMEGFPEVMDTIKELAKKYVTSVDLYDPEEEEEITDEDPEEDTEEPVEDDTEEPAEDDAEDKEVVESYIKEHNFDHNLFESEYEIYAPYSSEKQALKLEKDLRKFKSAEVFRHADIGEVHAYIKVK